MTEGPQDRDASRPMGVAGAAHGPTPTNVAALRLPGHLTPEAHAVAVERLCEAMILCATISRPAADAFLMMLKVASVAAPFGEHGAQVSKIITSLTKRLDTHLATLPNQPPPAA
jgi:hypothetical protein